MTEFYPEQQSTNLTDSSPLITNSTMPSFYPPSARHRTILTKQLTNRDDDDEHDHDSISKEAFIIQIFQHWKIKALEHQQALNASANHFTSAGQSSESTPNIEIPTDENTAPVQHPPAIRKRVTPLRRKDPLKKTVSAPIELSNPNLLAPDTKSKVRSNLPKKAPKPGPIFIAPKKTQLPAIPRGYSLYCPDDVKRRTPIDDEHQHHTNRSFLSPISNSIDDDDGTSSDDSSHESLFLRNRSAMKKPVVPKEEYILPSHVIIPTAIMITDPYGYSHAYDADGSVFSGDKYRLHSIGEEDEGLNEKNQQNGLILSKELNRIEAFTRSRQTSTDSEQQTETKALGRRWSDGGVSDEDEHSPPSSIVKVASVTSVVKPAKVSKTKYLLMKLHLTSSSKDDESNNCSLPPPRKRVVRRSSDKKRYQTR